MSSHHKHAKPNDSQGSAATDRKDHDTLTVSILVSRDNRPNILYPQKGRRLCVDDRERGGILEVEGDASHPPILMKPTPGIPLVIYISVVEEVVSVMMATLALVIASRRLRPYFQGHLIIMRMNLPIKQVLRKPDLAGKMVAWSVQLSEFDISYESRGHIRAQALAEFVTKMTTGSLEAKISGRWLLLVDKASNQVGSGTRVILEGPNGVLIEQSLHFEFKASNNQAEYEALLAGIGLAKELEAKVLTAKSDSKLITRQVNGEYQDRDPQLVKYLDKTTKLAAAFEKFTLHYVPREQNKRADLLSKLATS
ncbi:rnhA, partial [Mucuna pruriens]